MNTITKGLLHYLCPFNWGLFWLMAAFLAVTA